MSQFTDISDFLAHLTDYERIIVEELREIVFESIPDVREKLSYNVPYFYRKRRICFIWPASVPWGKVKSEGVLFGFCYGNLLVDEMNYLEKGDRKQVFTKTFLSVEEINREILRKYLYESVDVDDLFRK